MLRGTLMTTAMAGVLSEGWPVSSEYNYAKFASEFGKMQEGPRKEIFNANMKLINLHNANPEKTWVAGPNEFTDWTNDEFRALRTSYRPRDAGTQPVSHVSNLGELPAHVDWRESRGVVTPPKNQGSCGSCWAFSATETLESHFALATKQNAPVLAPQQIVSCDKWSGGGGGCQGGTQELAFNYTSKAGLSLEKDYPYRAVTGTCETAEIKPVVINAGYVHLKQNDYTALLTSCATTGPVAISVAAGGLGWQFYFGGIFGGGLFGCGFDVDHAVQLVGYGEESSKMYWLVRNSWGSWGENGYIRILRNGEGKEPCGESQGQKYCGLCGILSDSSYPTGVRSYGADALLV